MDDNPSRLALQTKLETAFPGMNIYFRPSGNLELEFPCVVYEPKAEEPAFASNLVYILGMRFQVSLLSELPGLDPAPMRSITGVVINGHQSYVSSDIVHDVYIVSINSIT